MKDLTIFFIVNTVTAINYTLPIALYTKLAYSRGLTETYVGFIFAFYSVISLLMIPFTNKLILAFNRFNLLIIGSFVRTSATLLFLSLELIYDETLFIVISFITKGLQGLSIEIVNIIIFSFASSIAEEGEDSSKNLSYVEMATSVGYIIGPFLSFCFGSFGYYIPFLLCIILELSSIYLLFFSINTDINELNRIDSEEEIDMDLSNIQSVKKGRSYSACNIDYIAELSEGDKVKNTKHIKYRKHFNENLLVFLSQNELDSIDSFYSHDVDFESADKKEDPEESNSLADDNKISAETLTNIIKNESLLSLLALKPIFFTFLVVFVDFVCQNFFSPVFVLVMKRNFNLNAEASSGILSLMFSVYFISLKYISFFLKHFPAKFLLCFGLLINSFATLLMNPIHSLPQSLYISVFSFCLLNAFSSFSSIGSLVDLTNSLKKLGLNDYLANDCASALYIFGVNIGDLFAPLIGGYFTNKYNFEFSSCFVGFMNLIVSITLFIVYHKKIWFWLKKGKKHKSV